MTQRNVEILIGRLLTDPALRRRFASERQAFLDELLDQGLELSVVEADALANADADELRALAQTLDRRLRRAEDTAGLVPSAAEEEER